jgi:predicted ATP-dependent serine protease
LPGVALGPTDELGLMEMTGEGLVSVLDPSSLFLADRRLGACGSVVAAVLEGTRPLCVEVQALVADTPAPMPRRAGLHRVQLLLSSPERRTLHRALDLALPDIHALPEARRTRWSLDVDPMDLY